jgi:glycosyltransferase involved in cell wall biosynthesis
LLGDSFVVRTLWVSHLVPYPPKSGVHLRSFNLLRGVAALHEVDLIAFVQEQWLSVFYKSHEDGLERCERSLREFCKSVRFLPIEKLQRPGGKWRTALEGLVVGSGYTVGWLQGRSAREVFARSARSKYDLAHFDTIGLAPYRSLVDAGAATLGHHNIESQMMLRRASNEINLLKKGYFYQEGIRLERYEAAVTPKFDANITCSELDSERLKAIAPCARTVCVPNGVDIDYFTPQACPENPESLVFVGSLNWYPNVEAVLFLLKDIWPLLKSRFPSMQLDIVGSAPPRLLCDLARSLDGVRVHGFVDDVRPFIARASLYVCPIRDGGGTKLKLLDAFAMGKCVVAHPIACEGIDAVPGTHVVHAVEASEFVAAIEGLMANAERRAAIGRAARGLAEERYSFRGIGEKLAGTFSRLARTAGV